MRRSKNKKGHTRVDHVTFDLILPNLSPIAQLVFLRIYRQTIGWSKKSDSISYSEFRETVGAASDQTIRDGLYELRANKLIKWYGNHRETKEYEINLEVVASYKLVYEKCRQGISG